VSPTAASFETGEMRCNCIFITIVKTSERNTKTGVVAIALASW
jgi:hypothetical protein